MGPIAPTPVGQAIGLATSLEVATSPLSNSSAGFVFKVDPTTGLKVRTATTFGPSFAERALTAGEGKVSVGVSFTSANYSKLGDLSLDRMQLSSGTGNSPAAARTGLASLVVLAETLVIGGSMGVTDNLDLAVGVPLMRVKVDGISWGQNRNGDVLLLAKGSGISSGVGDISLTGKYRLLGFGKGVPDPGGLAAVATVRIPTGDPDNLRGLGITRTLVSLAASGGQGRFRPHANGGFEYWSDGVKAVTDFKQGTSVTARHQVQWAAGLEFEAAPKLTLILDVLGRNILGAGKVGFKTSPAADNPFGVTSYTSAVALPEGVQKLTLVPGLKLNLKGNMLLSLHGLTAIRDTGLHNRFTPVVGIDVTF